MDPNIQKNNVSPPIIFLCEDIGFVFFSAPFLPLLPVDCAVGYLTTPSSARLSALLQAPLTHRVGVVQLWLTVPYDINFKQEACAAFSAGKGRWVGGGGAERIHQVSTLHLFVWSAHFAQTTLAIVIIFSCNLSASLAEYLLPFPVSFPWFSPVKWELSLTHGKVEGNFWLLQLSRSNTIQPDLRIQTPERKLSHHKVKLFQIKFKL